MPPVRGIGSSRYTTQNQGGGNKKQGLPPSVGLGQFSFRIIRRKAGGYLRNSNNNSNTCQNEFIFYYTEEGLTDIIEGLSNFIVFLRDGEDSDPTNDVTNVNVLVLKINSNICNFSFILGSIYTITITQGQNINKLSCLYNGADDVEYFAVIDTQNISGGTTYLNGVPVLVAINNNANNNANNKWCQSGFQLLMSPDNYVISSGPAVIFVNRTINNMGEEVVNFTNDISTINLIGLGVYTLIGCNNFSISNLIENKITSLTISQGDNENRIIVTSQNDDALDFNNSDFFTNYDVSESGVVNISGGTIYSQDTPIAITFNV